MNPIGSISNLSGDLLIAVIAGLVFIEESGVPVPFAPGDLLLMIAGIAIASGTVDPVPMVAALLLATVIGAMIGPAVSPRRAPVLRHRGHDAGHAGGRAVHPLAGASRGAGRAGADRPRGAPQSGRLDRRAALSSRGRPEPAGLSIDPPPLGRPG